MGYFAGAGAGGGGALPPVQERAVRGGLSGAHRDSAVHRGDRGRRLRPKAIAIIKETSLLPAVCGRVCPQEIAVPGALHGGQGPEGRGQGRVDRAPGALSWRTGSGQAAGGRRRRTVAPATGKKVAVVGSGPAGITVAADVRREGHAVTLFEAFHKPGGVLVYGIPEFRLPKAIVRAEIDTLQQMGVEIRTNFVVGRTRKITDLIEKDGFDAVFVGTGAGLPKFMNIEGENLVGVFSANEYLTRVEPDEGLRHRARA